MIPSSIHIMPPFSLFFFALHSPPESMMLAVQLFFSHSGRWMDRRERRPFHLFEWGTGARMYIYIYICKSGCIIQMRARRIRYGATTDSDGRKSNKKTKRKQKKEAGSMTTNKREGIAFVSRLFLLLNAGTPFTIPLECLYRNANVPLFCIHMQS